MSQVLREPAAQSTVLHLSDDEGCGQIIACNIRTESVDKVTGWWYCKLPGYQLLSNQSR